MCGKEAGTYPVLIEGTELKVCPACAKHGKILKKPQLVVKAKKPVREEPEKIIIKNYAEIIKRKREDLGLKQEEFAKLVNEKVSVIQSIESGHLKPTLKLAEKLKKQLGITLVEEVAKTNFKKGNSEEPSFTLKDFIKKKH